MNKFVNTIVYLPAGNGCPVCGALPWLLMPETAKEGMERFDKWTKAHVAMNHPQEWDVMMAGVSLALLDEQLEDRR